MRVKKDYLLTYDEIDLRRAKADDNFEELAKLIYDTDPYIYPYWFECLENCIEELPKLLKENNFIFNINNLYIAIDEITNKIAGLVCAIDKNAELEYDYSKLKEKNMIGHFI